MKTWESKFTQWQSVPVSSLTPALPQPQPSENTRKGKLGLESSNTRPRESNRKENVCPSSWLPICVCVWVWARPPLTSEVWSVKRTCTHRGNMQLYPNTHTLAACLNTTMTHWDYIFNPNSDWIPQRKNTAACANPVNHPPNFKCLQVTRF